jgi:hypothetical protein
VKRILLGLGIGVLIGGGGAGYAVSHTTPNRQNYKVCLATRELQRVVSENVRTSIGTHPFLVYRISSCLP